MALCAAPAPDTIAAILGILQAGAAFVPIDPAYPADRVDAMLAVCRPRVVLTDERLLGWRPLREWPRMSLREAVAGDSVPAAPDPGPPERAAYVVFTSGSTGAPKGVLVQHSGLANLVDEQIAAFGIDRSSRVLQFASLSFDAAVSELFTALCAGATLCLVERPGDRQGVALLDLLEQRRISVVTLPPSLLRVLPARELPHLTTLVSAGEACSAEIVRRWWRPGRRLINAYGPSESTVCATMKQLAGPDDPPAIGTPLRGIDAHVLDGALVPAPAGEAGELFLGGVGLARGYAGDPARTAERFLPDPLSGRPGARLYRTGDRVTRTGGELHFVGRSDDQVKVRGFRVEPGDAAAALRRTPGVRDALVMARRRASGDVALVAHIIGDATEDDLRAFARRQLPDHLQPAEYQFHERWPRTTSGKVDRAELGRRAQPAHRSGGDSTAAAIGRLFEELLEIAPVDPARSFFEQGGDSILAIRLLLAIEAELGVRLRLGALLEHPSPAGLAALVARGAGGEAAPLALRTGSGQPLWLVAPVHGNPLCYLELARRFPAGRAVLGLQAPGLERGDGEPIGDFAELARHQIQLMRKIQPGGPYLVGGWSLGGTLAFEMAVQLQAAGDDVPLLVLVASTPPSADHIEVAREVMADYAPWRISYMFARAICLSTGADVGLSLDEFRDQPAEVAYRLIGERLDGVGPVAGTSTEEIARWIQVFRATLRGFHHHAPGSRFRGRALVLKPSAVNPFLTRDPFVTRQAPPGDWRDHVDGAVDFQPVGGDHYGLMSRPWVEEVVDRMSGWLDAHATRRSADD